TSPAWPDTLGTSACSCIHGRWTRWKGHLTVLTRPRQASRGASAPGHSRCARKRCCVSVTTAAARGRGSRSGRFFEDCPEAPVRPPDVPGPPPAGDERENLFGVLTRDRGRLVGPHIRQLSQRDLKRGRHPVQAVDGDRFLPALDLADEFARQPGAITQPLLAESALLAERPQPLPQELSNMFRRAFAHGLVCL